MRIVSIIVLALAACLFATARSPKDSDDKVAQELMRLEREWSAAYLRHDASTVERILADDYVGIDGRGVVTSKPQEIQEAKGPEPGTAPPPFTVLDESVTDMTVRAY